MFDNHFKPRFSRPVRDLILEYTATIKRENKQQGQKTGRSVVLLNRHNMDCKTFN